LVSFLSVFTIGGRDFLAAMVAIKGIIFPIHENASDAKSAIGVFERLGKNESPFFPRAIAAQCRAV